jgi:glycine cleavage system H protein
LPAARPDLAVALLAVPQYGCAARRNLGPLATAIERPKLCVVGGRVIGGGFACPSDLWYLIDDQVWARLEGDGTATVGITALGVHLAGEIYMCRPKLAGIEVAQGRGLAVVELAKSIVSVKSPVTGTVVEANARLAAEPELVFRDPYGAGWLARLRLVDFEADRAALLHGEAVGPAMERHAWLHRAGDA